uniref:Immunoglobulin V-set domain-containing protein n=1 Tax=Cyprinus carpio TaxID=7962 RepID=A0A8C1M7E3_CYPCA
MACFVRYSFLLISICLRSTSWADSMLQVTSLIGAVGNNIIIQCAADKTPQDGVYLYKQEGASKNKQEVFYYYKDGTFSPKSKWCRDKVKVNGTFPNFNVIVLNVKATDIGLYWCEFNLQDKKSVGTVTWLWIEESVDIKTNKTGEIERKGEAGGKDDEKVCSGDIHHHVKIFLIVCAVMLLLLCITGFIFVILKVKGCCRIKKYRPSNPPSDSVYEEMRRSTLDGQPSVRTLINPDYQSTKLLH